MSGTEAADRTPPRRRWPALVVATLVVMSGLSWWVMRPAPAANDTAGGELASTDEVTRKTLIDGETVDGELGFGEGVSLATAVPGTLTWAPVSGSTVRRGQRLYEIDASPVTLLYGSTPAYRELSSGLDGKDVRQLERNLSAMGYTGFTVDDEFTYYTSVAVEEWQEDLGVAETGVLELGQIVFEDGPIRIDTQDVGEGELLVAGTVVLAYTGTQQRATLDLDPGQRRFADRGTRAVVTLPDGSTVEGRVRGAELVVEQGESAEADPETVLRVSLEFTDRRAIRAVADYPSAAVDVTFTAERRKNVLTVPIAALVAVAEGGYGLEVVDDTTTHYESIETGMFAQGRVEVSGVGITEGTVVVVPS